MLTSSVGKNPVPYIASSRTSTGGSTGVKPRLAEPVEREPVERELEQRDVADAITRSASRRPSRHARGRFAGRQARDGRWTGKSNDGGSPQRRISTASSSVEPVRRRLVRRIRHRSSSSLRRPPPRRAAARATAARLLIRSSSSSCSGVGLPLTLRAARSSSTRGWISRTAAIRGQQLVEDLGRALPRERGAEAIRVVARCAEIDHGRESR